jgi:hypothetical protein
MRRLVLTVLVFLAAGPAAAQPWAGQEAIGEALTQHM